MHSQAWQRGHTGFCLSSMPAAGRPACHRCFPGPGKRSGGAGASGRHYHAQWPAAPRLGNVSQVCSVATVLVLAVHSAHVPALSAIVALMRPARFCSINFPLCLKDAAGGGGRPRSSEHGQHSGSTRARSGKRTAGGGSGVHGGAAGGPQPVQALPGNAHRARQRRGSRLLTGQLPCGYRRHPQVA